MLIIDDNDQVRAMLTQVVASLGYSPIEAGGGTVGLELAAAVAPDVVCLDLWMDDMNGLEVLDRIQHIRPELPVIVITADPLTDMSLDARAHGAFDYITKPFEMAQVRRALFAAMTRPRNDTTALTFGAR